MDTIIEKYFNYATIGIVELDCEDKCLEELSKTIGYLSEVAKLKSRVDKEYTKNKRDYEIFLATKSDIVRRNFKTKGISFTEQMVEDTVIRMNDKEYNSIRKLSDDSKTDYDLVGNLLTILYTRRDLIKEMINYYRYKMEKTDCLLLNKKFLQFVERTMEKL